MIVSHYVLHYLWIILITDNFAIQENNLLTRVFSVYKSSKTKLTRISYSLQYCLILNYLTEFSLNLILQHCELKPTLVQEVSILNILALAIGT